MNTNLVSGIRYQIIICNFYVNIILFELFVKTWLLAKISLVEKHENIEILESHENWYIRVFEHAEHEYGIII